MNKKNDMTKGSVMKHLVSFSVPVIIGNVFQQVYNIVDTAVVGKFLGSNALGSMGASGPIVFFLNTLVIGLSVGVTVVASQLFGARNYERLRKTIFMSVVMGIVVGLVLSVVGFVFSRGMMVMSGAPAEIIPGAEIFLKYMFGGFLISVFYNLMSGIMRALGDSRTPLYALVIASVLNVVLVLLFVVVFKKGIAGVAVATLISQFVSVAICVPAFKKKFGFLKFVKNDFRFEKGPFKEIIKIMVPTTFQYALTAFGFVIQQFSVNNFGAGLVAGNAAGNKVEQLFSTVFFAMGTVGSAFAGQNLGAFKIDRIKEGIKKLNLINCVMAVAFSLILYVFGKYIVLLFVDSGDVVVYRTSVEYLQLISLFLIPLALMHLYVAVVRSLNEPVVPMVSGFLEVACRSGLGLLAVFIFKNYYLIWLAAPLAWILTDPLIIWKYKKVLDNHFCKSMANTTTS